MSGNGNAVLRNKKQHRILRIAALAAAVLLLAVGITAAWQRVENERVSAGKEGSSKFAEAVFGFVNLLNDLTHKEDEGESAPEAAPSVPEGTESGSGPEGESEKPSPEGEAEEAALPAWGLLAESEPKELSYFEDTVLIGDAAALGAKESRSFGGASFLASAVVNADTILSKKVVHSGGESLSIPGALAAGETADRIYILMSVESIGWMDVPTYTKKFSAFLDAVIAAKPGRDLYLVSMPPVNEGLCAERGDEFRNADIDAINEKFLAMAGEKGFWYVNAAEALKDGSGGLPADAAGDGVTLETAAYETLRDYLLRHTAR